MRTNEIAAVVVFDLEDFDAAIAELDARYLAGEAAAYAHTWSIVAASYAGFNRRELLATTPDWVNIDHRRGAAFAPGDMIAYIQAAWDDSPDTKIYIGAVHRLSEIGAVVTHLAHGISQEGFDAEWRDVNVLTVEGDMFSRSELFDEADLDAAIARFDELSRPARRLENAASQATERFRRTSRRATGTPWRDAGRRLFQRRSPSGGRHRNPPRPGCRDREHAGGRRPRGHERHVDVIATRGERLVLSRTRFSDSDREPKAFLVELLGIVEIDPDERIVATSSFDLDDFDAAIAELDARYLAGEAAAHARTWSVVTQAYAALNRHELPAMTPDWVSVDHRRASSVRARRADRNTSVPAGSSDQKSDSTSRMCTG